MAAVVAAVAEAWAAAAAGVGVPPAEALGRERPVVLLVREEEVVVPGQQLQLQLAMWAVERRQLVVLLADVAVQLRLDHSLWEAL